jgi:uncharacterized protein YndB with AHSA1/START domain
MEQMQFTTDIHASKQTVWDTLWQDATFREWAGIVDPGTYMKGELKEGEEVQFLSAINGYGVTSLVEKITPPDFLQLRHESDTQDTGAQARAKEWTGGVETYTLTEKDGITTLTVAFGVPLKMVDEFKENYPKALQRVKEMAEAN